MKIFEFLKKWAWQILSASLMMLYLGQGCTNKKINKLSSQIEAYESAVSLGQDSLEMKIEGLVSTSITEKEARDIMEKVMLDYLIYEDDLDKGKISLSQIKDKIESND
jgi:outer membrane murein-binding lipoprotein Lpp